jgi:hypothetical protein
MGDSLKMVDSNSSSELLYIDIILFIEIFIKLIMQVMCEDSCSPIRELIEPMEAGVLKRKICRSGKYEKPKRVRKSMQCHMIGL